MNTCAECRFWKELDEHSFAEEPEAPGVWRECTREAEDGAAMFVTAADRYDLALMTRRDFGCVQFEPLPIPATMPVIYAGPGENVQPLPGHIVTAPNWPDTKTTALKVSIDGQWFEIRPKPRRSPVSWRNRLRGRTHNLIARGTAGKRNTRRFRGRRIGRRSSSSFSSSSSTST